MQIPFLPFLFRKPISRTPIPSLPEPATPNPAIPDNNEGNIVRRHFYNERGFQTYGSFFAHWDGYITAGHVLREAQNILPPFANGPADTWPGGLDAALIGCRLPAAAPRAPMPGQDVICIGYPAGSHITARRHAKVYMERPGSPDTWIARIITPDEPVVVGMSGGPVMDARTQEPIGIIITRNSPADLNNDRDPDESCDFISLSGVWNALSTGTRYV